MLFVRLAGEIRRRERHIWSRRPHSPSVSTPSDRFPLCFLCASPSPCLRGVTRPPSGHRLPPLTTAIPECRRRRSPSPPHQRLAIPVSLCPPGLHLADAPPLPSARHATFVTPHRHFHHRQPRHHTGPERGDHALDRRVAPIGLGHFHHWARSAAPCLGPVSACYYSFC
jgi:hypothetical protein